MEDNKKPITDVYADNNQVITIRTRSGYIIRVYTGDYLDKGINIDVEKPD